MDAYLFRLAKALYAEYGNRIASFTFVFPNRRAGLFFRKYLGQAASQPILAPDTITINQCFEQLSDLHITDQLSLLFRLYRIHEDIRQTHESFDNFVFWGEMMLSDFNEADAYLTDVKMLFSNINDLKTISNTFDYLTDTQKKAISDFWGNLAKQIHNEHQQKFLSMWSCLYSIYSRFSTELLQNGQAYEGLLQRKVIEELNTEAMNRRLNGKQFIFIGFNALTPCEKTFFELLQKNGLADFYWDYESEQLRDEHNRASLFYRENTTLFPSKITLPPNDREASQKAEMHLISVPSEVGQAKQAGRILDKLFPDNTNTDFTHTAIVLPDEKALLPMLHAIPAQIDNINVTMGYPLSATPIFGLMEHIFDLQMRLRQNKGETLFYHRSVQNILNHQYIYGIFPKEAKQISQEIIAHNSIYIPAEKLAANDFLHTIFTPQTSAEGIIEYVHKLLKLLQTNIVDDTDNTNAQLDREYIYQYYVTINRIRDLFNEENAPGEIKPETVFKLLREITAGISIPFAGEPLNGLQIMGVLETRALSFDNLIITSMNEGVFPKHPSNASFIPYNLRRGFGLPTYEQQDAVFSYNFYCMLHHAKRIFFIYNNQPDGAQKGEVSRYIHQLRYQYGIELPEEKASFGLSSSQNGEISIPKTEQILGQLDALADAQTGRGLSASALNTYIDCPLKFYLSYINKLAETDEVKETIEANMFGTILHATMQNLYEPYKGRMLHSDTIEELLKSKELIKREIARAYTENQLHQKDGKIVYPEGNDRLAAQVIESYVHQLLKNDQAHTPFTYVDSELLEFVEIPILQGKKRIKLKGFIDRVDEKEGNVRIIDYKTGRGELTFKNLEDVFDANSKERPKYVLQTLLYCMLYQAKNSRKQLTPHIFYIRLSHQIPFESQLICKPDSKTSQPIADYREYEPEFTERLTALLEEIYNPEVPFGQCTDKKHCEYCPFTGICGR